jgi:hypothetical protein
MDELSSPERARLRASTWLAPGIPLAFFEGVCRYLASALGCEGELASETRSSGPMDGDHDPFAAGLALFGLERLVPVTDSDYEDERRALAALERIPVAAGGSTPSHLP